MSEIIQFVDEAIEKIAENNKEGWIFLDEINTCSHLGLITELVCNRSFLGELLPPNLVVLGACNPYLFLKIFYCYTPMTNNSYRKRKLGGVKAGIEGKRSTDAMSQLVYQ